MKNSTLILLILSLGLSSIFSSCSNDDDDGMEIVGTWELVSEKYSWGFKTVVTEVMEFNANKTGTMTTHVKMGAFATSSEAYDFTYKYNGSSLTINSKDVNQTTKAYVKGQILTIEAEANGEVHRREYTRLTEEDINEREEQLKNEEVLQKLVGQWKYYHSGYNEYDQLDVYEAIFTFNNDMTGSKTTYWTIDDFVQTDEKIDFTYKVSDNILTITVNNHSGDYEMVFDGKDLTLIFQEDKERKATYTRVE